MLSSFVVICCNLLFDVSETRKVRVCAANEHNNNNNHSSSSTTFKNPTTTPFWTSVTSLPGRLPTTTCHSPTTCLTTSSSRTTAFVLKWKEFVASQTFSRTTLTATKSFSFHRILTFHRRIKASLNIQHSVKKFTMMSLTRP